MSLGEGRVRGIGAPVLARLQAVLVFAALATVPLTIAEVNGQTGYPFQVADWAVWAVFASEYALALALADNRRRHFVRSWLPLLVVVVSFPLLPSLLALMRLARLARLLRIVRLIAFGVRALPALKATLGRRGVVYVLTMYLMLILMAGAVMSVVEPETVKGNLWDGVWWAIVTATTVGYGDIAPVTATGRLVAIVLMLFGIGLAATLAASVAAYFVSTEHTDEFGDVVARLDRMEALLVELKAHGVRTGPAVVSQELEP